MLNSTIWIALVASGYLLFFGNIKNLIWWFEKEPISRLLFRDQMLSKKN